MHPVKKLEEIKNTQGSKAKADLVKAYKDDKDFLFLLKILLDPFEVTNVKSLEKPTHPTGFWSKDQTEFRNLVKYLKATNRSNKTLQTIQNFLAKLNPKEAEILAGVLTKSYKIGVGIKTVNKALGYSYLTDFTLMKAEPFREDIIPFGKDGTMFVQEKLDGVRCLIKVENGVVSAFTFKGYSLQLPNIFKAVLNFCKRNGLDNIVFDGELLHNTSRGKATATINRILKNDVDKADDEMLSLSVFYYMTLEEFYTKEQTQSERDVVRMLSTLRQNHTNKHLNFVETYLVRNMNEVDKLFKGVREKGGEGLILKNPDGKYEFKRSKYWLKLKSIYRTTLEVVDTYLGKPGSKYEGIVGGLVCQTSDGILLSAGSGISDDDRLTFTDKSTILGKFVEVAFTDVAFSDEGEAYLDFPRYKGDRTFEKSEADSFEKIVAEIPRFKNRKGKI